MIRKLINSLRFRRKKDQGPLDDAAGMDGDGATDDDLPFNELPIPVQLARLPKHPPSRRWRLSKALLLTLFASPVAAAAIGLIPVLDPETGWRLFHLNGPQTQAAIPGTERELQEEIAQNVRDVEERARAEREAQENGKAGATGAHGAGDAPGHGDATATGHDGTAENGGENAAGTGTSPEELAALAEQGALEGPIEPDPLRPAPIPGLDEEGSFGRVPRIADDGTTPYGAYRRPFETREGQPYVAVIVTGVGLNAERSTSAIEDLPLNISLGLSPYARDLPDVARQAREMGHEVFLQLPMEPIDFPLSDPGPRALLTSLPEGENLVRLEWLLARFPGYVGVVSHLGTKFSSLDSSIRPIIESVTRTGLMYVEGTHSGAVSLGTQLAANADGPNAVANIAIDDIPSRRQIDARLADLVELAKRDGFAIGIAQSYPVTIQRLRNWSVRLARQGVVLAPVSALSQKQVTPQSDEEAEAARKAAEEAEMRAMRAAAAEQEKADAENGGHGAESSGNGHDAPAPEHGNEGGGHGSTSGH